ncbi:hypothetical protein MGR01S_28850 [Meiothermus granaticius NBRC 107808]|uniref:Uncharacterized protein n=1 Tax=Meiothermus granaticius NBRC 107808 TaxID=1227551 RepID=A0A399F460_9DEIN|nr:hypothetical protein Mgrana_02592 [Meiothermus granaticius NBRC 107808]GEM88260.1 hypothetical protein MGR01S_28850 [Meiothermus granaticius NBRC 107808]
MNWYEETLEERKEPLRHTPDPEDCRRLRAERPELARRWVEMEYQRIYSVQFSIKHNNQVFR